MADKEIRVSVRDLVEFILRSGDIDSRYAGAARMREGVRVHQALQNKRAAAAAAGGWDYERERALAITVQKDGFGISVEGRADGIIRKEGEPVRVEEIKSTLGAVSEIEADESHWHFAQAKCYAYMLAKAEGLGGKLAVTVAYCHAETGETAEFSYEYDFGELEAFFTDLTDKYYEWAKNDFERRERRDVSIKASPFVHASYRKGQRELSVMVYRAIEDRANLFAQAPTGTGKTISTLFPAVKAMGEGLCVKIFYLTAKTVTRRAAEENAALLREKGHDLLCVTLTAKDKICLAEERICSPDFCPYARGHFDRANAALADILAGERLITRVVVIEYAKKHRVCPHEFTLDITTWADIIICDYNYVFDPRARLKRFFGEAPKEDYVILADEAHNLADRSREMFSCSISKGGFLGVRKYFKDADKGLYSLAGKINMFFLDYRKSEIDSEGAETIVRRELPEDIGFLLTDFAARADKFLARASLRRGEAYEKLLELYFRVLDYLAVSERFDRRYRFMAAADKLGGVEFRLLCLDPSAMLREIHEKARTGVFFSATLTPLSYFRRVFGGRDEDAGFKLASPFPRENLCLAIERGVSTRYRDRARGYEAIADGLYAMCSGKKGNYMAFFSSYAYLREVLGIFSQKYTDVDILIQRQDFSEDEREGFLANFTEDSRQKSLLAFSVLGGIFSEGIDLAGERLIGVAVVGVGLPLVSPERSLIREYYDETIDEGRGFEYAYVYPGINKVLQAAGRLIRTETDRGVVLLIDDRYALEEYRALFPKEWEGAAYARGEAEIRELVGEFWRGDGAGAQLRITRGE